MNSSSQAAVSQLAFLETPAAWVGLVGLVLSLLGLVTILVRQRKSPAKSFAALVIFFVLGMFVSASMLLLPMVDAVTTTSSGSGDDEGS